MMANQKRNRIKEAWQYIRATEAVSRPIAYLMMFFGVAFIASLAVGLFLVGRWGYRKVVPLDEPVVITTPVELPARDSTKAAVTPSDSGEKNVRVDSPDEKVQTTNNRASTSALPDTGSNLYALTIPVAVVGYLLSMARYWRRTS